MAESLEPSTPKPPYDIKTDDFGLLLMEEYGEKSHNASIDHFMIMLGKPVSRLLEETGGQHDPEPPEITEEEFSEMLKRLNFHFSTFREKGWKSSQKLLVFKFPKSSGKNEREQEQEINSLIREDLKTNLKEKLYYTSLPHVPDAGIILTRACLYTEKPPTIRQTNKIGAILKSKYQTGENTAIDYFYLIIQEESGYKSLDDKALEILSDLPGKWEAMSEKEKDWPGVFIGYYTDPFMTERQREWNLNQKVRDPLIKKVKEKIIEAEAEKGEESFEPKVHVIMTRACVYTAHEQCSS